jgi:hypothetical protein
MNYVEKCFFKTSISAIIREERDSSTFEHALDNAYRTWLAKSHPAYFEECTRDPHTSQNVWYVYLNRFLNENGPLVDTLGDPCGRLSGRRELELEFELELSETVYRYYWRSRWVLTLVNLSINSLRTSTRNFQKGAVITRLLGVRLFRKLLRQE